MPDCCKRLTIDASDYYGGVIDAVDEGGNLWEKVDKTWISGDQILQEDQVEEIWIGK